MVDEHITYPFSHNHGFVENHPSLKDTNIGDTPIFDFHDYGKCKPVDPTGIL